MIYKLSCMICNLAYKMPWSIYFHVHGFIVGHAAKYLTIDELSKLTQHRLYGGKL